jgi:hypothetical protein
VRRGVQWAALSDAQRRLVPPAPTGPHERLAARVGGCLDPVLASSVFNAWAVALRSSNVTLKALAARAAAGVLGEALDDVRVLACARSAAAAAAAAAAPGGAGVSADDAAVVDATLARMQAQRRARLGHYLDMVSAERVGNLCLVRMAVEACRGPVRSHFLHALLELSSLLAVARRLASSAHLHASVADAVIDGVIAAVGDAQAVVGLDAEAQPAAGGWFGGWVGGCPRARRLRVHVDGRWLWDGGGVRLRLPCVGF